MPNTWGLNQKNNCNIEVAAYQKIKAKSKKWDLTHALSSQLPESNLITVQLTQYKWNYHISPP